MDQRLCCTSSSKSSKTSGAACASWTNVANEYPFPVKWSKAFQPQHCLMPNKDLRAVERHVLFDLLPACLPAFLPCTWQSLGWGCLHTSKAPGGWLLLRQKPRRWRLRGAKGRRGWAKNRPSTAAFQTRSCRLQQCQTSHTTWSNSKLKSKRHEARQGPWVQLRPQSMEKRGWNNRRLYKCRGAAAVLAWPLALLPKTWPTAVHMSPSGTKGTEVGGGDGKEKGSAGWQRVAWRSAAGCQSAHCCQARKHERVTLTHKHI